MRGGACIGVTVCLLLGAACAAEDNEIITNVRTDLLPGVEFVGVRTTVGSGSKRRVIDRLASRDEPFIEGVRVAEVSRVSGGSQDVRVALLDTRGDTVASRLARVRVSGSTVITIVLTRSCLGVTCPGPGDDPSAVACLARRCIDPACTPENPEGCGTPECGTDSSCTTDVACAQGRCVLGGCLFEARDERCPTGMRCAPDRGCVSAGVDAGPEVDSGPPDAGAPRVDAGPAMPSVTFVGETAGIPYVVPAGVTSITVKLWGGGGGGGSECHDGGLRGHGAAGGGAGFVQGTLDVTPEEILTVRVGGGGRFQREVNTTGIGGSGGGYSGIFRGTTPLLVAGGGGGGGGGGNNSTTLRYHGTIGGAGGDPAMSGAPNPVSISRGGGGATTSGPGLAGAGMDRGTDGSMLQGGRGATNGAMSPAGGVNGGGEGGGRSDGAGGGGGGGGGIFGGGGGASDDGGTDDGGCGGGGGANFVSGRDTHSRTGSGIMPANPSDPAYLGTAGRGGTGGDGGAVPATDGSPGLVLIYIGSAPPPP